MAARSQARGTYEPEKPLSYAIRGEILVKCDRRVSKNTNFSWFATRTVLRKMVNHFQWYGTLTAFALGECEPRDVLQCKSIACGREIQNKLFLEGVCDGFTLPETEFWFEHQFAHFWNECILWTTNGLNSQILFSLLIESTGIPLTWFDCKPYDITYACYNSVFFFL